MSINDNVLVSVGASIMLINVSIHFEVHFVLNQI